MIHNIDNLTSVRQLLPNLARIDRFWGHRDIIDGFVTHVNVLVITDNKDLENLNFKKLFKMYAANVKITGNPRLCTNNIGNWFDFYHIYPPLEPKIEVRNLLMYHKLQVF